MADKPAEEIDLMRALVESMPDPTDISLVPPQIKAAIDNYVSLRRRPGSFVVSVLKNDLKGACGRADPGNIRILPAIVAYCYREIPEPCWGSHDVVEAWVTPEEEDESMATTTQRARREGLKRIVSEHRGLLRVDTDEGQRLQVLGTEDDPEVVIISASRGVPA